jgi:DNA recombination protein RmuC
MAALLNSLQMGFKTLAIQKRSSEVWQVLGAVKTEFEKFGDGLSKMQQHLRQTDEDLDRLIGTRTRAINRKLRQVQTLDGSTAAALLELDAEEAESARPALPQNTPEDADTSAPEWD